MTEDSILQILDASQDQPATRFSDLVEMLETQSKIYGSRKMFCFLEDGENESDSKSFTEIQRSAKALAVELSKSANAGDRVLLLFPAGIDFVAGLFGCFYSGLVAVPAYPPRKNRSFRRFEAIVRNCDPKVILTTRKIYHDIQKNYKDEDILVNANYVVYEDVDPGNAGQWKKPEITPQSLALLQYTSGSTGTPDGVMLTHRNILVNSAFIQKAFGHTDRSVGVNWLPPYHDMGLIGVLIQPIYVGFFNVIMPPSAFLLRPVNWLKAIGKYKATTAGGPNFALEHCVDRIKPEDKDTVDLTSVRPLFCGAEPVRKNTLERFTDFFKDHGMTADKIYPCYGLAESVLIVTGGDLMAKPVYCFVDEEGLKKGKVVIVEPSSPGARSQVGCGFPMAGTKVVISNSAGDICKRGQIGEICVSGPSVAAGYWGDPIATNEVFGAFLNGSDGPYLRTGDLGFIEDGHLFITGRIKDLVIIRGQNFYPHDLEATVEASHEVVAPASAMAFMVDEQDNEKLALVAEVKRSALKEPNMDHVIEAIRHAITEVHGLQPGLIVLTRPGSVPKTSSGKNQRFECRKMLIEGTLDEITRWEAKASDTLVPLLMISEESIQQWIKLWMAKELNIDPLIIDIDKPVTAYGLDSMKAVLLANDAGEAFNIEWPLEIFLEITTIRKITETGMNILKDK